MERQAGLGQAGYVRPGKQSDRLCYKDLLLLLFPFAGGSVIVY